jgi:hypothetical protein
MRRVHLEAAEDHVERLAKENDPIGAVKELIWNGLDADATHISVKIGLSPLDGVERVTVSDNGTGIVPEECERAFDRIGGSWKKGVERTLTLKRIMHGQTGQGRLRGYALGHHIQWTTIAESSSGGRFETVIRASAAARNDFEISEPTPTNHETGTVFEAWGKQSSKLDQLTTDLAITKIITEFAPYLTVYKDVGVDYNGTPVDPKAAILKDDLYELRFIIGKTEDSAQLRVIEWSMKTDRELHLCDANGITVDITDVGIRAPGFNFTAYVLWKQMPHHQAEYLLGEGTDSAEQRKEIVAKWKTDRVYPYSTEPSTDSERLERETFDHVASTIHRQLPKNSPRQQRVALTLISEAIKHQPDNVHSLLDRLFRLTADDKAKLERLLNRTELSNIIKAASEVTNRLDFLTALSHMVFEPEVRKLVKERTELHKILERETWIFGEHFQQLLSDRSLDAVLDRHLAKLGRDVRNSEPVRRDDGSIGIVDLMLSRANRENGTRQHLIVELKAPRVVVGLAEVFQIQSYADAVIADAQFRDTDTRWDFWLVTTNMTDAARRQARKTGLPVGCIHQVLEGPTSVRVWLRSWSEIVEECKDRLHYFREHLEHDPNIEQVNTAHAAGIIPEPLRIATQRLPSDEDIELDAESSA